MLGPGGRFVTPLSESAELSEISYVLTNKVLPNMVARDPNGIRYAKALIADVLARLATLQDQVAGGYHRNPSPLLVIHNPPIKVRRMLGSSRVIGVMSQDVHEIRYTHADDGQSYKHEFGDGVQMFAVERDGFRDIHLTHVDGKPLWEDFG